MFIVPPAPEARHPQGMTPARSLSLASEERAAFLIFAAILAIGSIVMTLLAVHLITLLRAHPPAQGKTSAGDRMANGNAFVYGAALSRRIVSP